MGGDTKNSSPALVILTQEQLEQLIRDTMRSVLAERDAAAAGYYTTEGAAMYLNTTKRSVQHAVANGSLVPDHRGQRGGGLKSNHFSKATLDDFMLRRRGAKVEP